MDLCDTLDEDSDGLSPEEMEFARSMGWLDDDGDMMDLSGDNTMDLRDEDDDSIEIQAEYVE